MSVGEFDSEYEFVTIKLTLTETPQPVRRDIPLIQRSKTALEWTVWTSLGIASAFFLIAGAAALLMVVVQLWRNVTKTIRTE